MTSDSECVAAQNGGGALVWAMLSAAVVSFLRVHRRKRDGIAASKPSLA